MKSEENGHERLARRWRGMVVRIVGTLLCGWLVCIPVAQAQRVAIFDFDDRATFPDALSLHIEASLRAALGDLQIDHYTGKGDERRSIQILLELDRQNLDLIVVRTSDALIIALHTLFHTPTLYTNVNNPKILGFRSLGPPGGNISGASYYIPIAMHMKAYKLVQPSLTRPGFVFDKSNKSHKAEVPEAREACVELGMTFDMEIIEQKEQLPAAVKALIQRGVDAIVTATSGIIYENIDTFLDLTNQAGVPVYSLYKTGVYKGAVAALSSDYFQMADELLLPMAIQVLRHGVSPGTMPVAFLKTSRMFVNSAQVARLGLQVPDTIFVDGATVVVETIGP